MNATPSTLLAVLPAYKDEWRLVNKKQSVADIIVEISNAHARYASYYDLIALYFDDIDTREISRSLFDFCKRYIKYREEPEKSQTTALPTGILTRGYGDCKHYASFCGGVLDALNRLKGRNIDWHYRFASYRWTRKTPHHVFIVVIDDGEELWIDPTPKADTKIPIWVVDKTISVDTMPLYTNIAGVEDERAIAALAIPQAVTPVIEGDMLGLSQYAMDPGVIAPLVIIKTKWGELANEINQLIQQGPGPKPGRVVDAAFVKWIFTENIKSWNFYEPMGIAVGFNGDSFLPPDYPRLVVTPDFRLTFDRDYVVEEAGNQEIHILTAWAQSLINELDNTPYPIKPRHLREFSVNFKGNPDNTNANLFNEHRGKSIFRQIGEAVGKFVKAVGRTILKIVGSIPRNAFLALVGLNVFNMAGNLWDKIQGGQWDQMASRWRNLGGNPEKLKNTIEDGHDKKAILGDIDDEAMIGEATSGGTAALLAAAAPIIAAMIKWLDKDGKLREVLNASRGIFEANFPGIAWGDTGLFDIQTGDEIIWQVDPEDDENKGGGNNDLPGDNKVLTLIKENPIPVALVAGGATYFITNKKGKKPNFIVPILVAGATWAAIHFGSKSGSSTNKRQALIDWINGTNESASDKQYVVDVFKRMTEIEIGYTYTFIFNYVIPNRQVPEGNELRSQMTAISNKYNIFT